MTTSTVYAHDIQSIRLCVDGIRERQRERRPIIDALMGLLNMADVSTRDVKVTGTLVLRYADGASNDDSEVGRLRKAVAELTEEARLLRQHPDPRASMTEIIVHTSGINLQPFIDEVARQSGNLEGKP